MADKRDVLTPLEDGSGRASPVHGVSDQPCLGEDRPNSPVSDHSTTGRLNFAHEVPKQPLQHTPGRVGSCENVMGSRRVIPAACVADSLQSVGMAEECRFQLEIKRLELEAEERRMAAEERRLEAEERREARRLEA